MVTALLKRRSPELNCADLGITRFSFVAMLIESGLTGAGPGSSRGRGCWGYLTFSWVADLHQENFR
jgi:hypothetical protein